MARAKRHARWRADAMEDVLAVLERVVCLPALGVQQTFQEVGRRQFAILRRIATGEDILSRCASQRASQRMNSVDVSVLMDIIK